MADFQGEPNTSQEEDVMVKEEPEDIVMIDLTSPKRARTATPAPAPAPVKFRRSVAPASLVEPKLELKRVAPTPAPAPRLQQKEHPEVKRGRAVEAKAVERKQVERKAIEEAELVEKPAPARHEAAKDVEAVQQPGDDKEPMLPREPTDHIVRKYKAPETAHIQLQQSTNMKEEKRRTDYRLKLPVFRAQDRVRNKLSTHSTQRFANEVPKERREYGKSVGSAKKEAKVKEPMKDITEVSGAACVLSWSDTDVLSFQVLREIQEVCGLDRTRYFHTLTRRHLGPGR